MKDNTETRKYGRGDDKKDERLVMRTNAKIEQRLTDLTQYLCLSRSDVMREALDRLYDFEGGDEIRNKPPKNANVHINLGSEDLNKLTQLTNNGEISASDIVKRALDLYSAYKDTTKI